MARMVPNTAPKSLAGHLAKVWRQLKEIGDEDLVCRISFQIQDDNHPDFLLIYKNRSAFLLTVSNATKESIEAYHQNDFLDPNQLPPKGLEESDHVGMYSSQVLQSLGASGDAPIQHWILFPNVPNRTIARIARNWSGSPRQFLGKQDCRSRALKKQIYAAGDHQLDQQVLNLIIGRFAPEAAIPSSWVTREEHNTNTNNPPEQLDFLLDYNQEDAMKRDLELSSEAFKAASAGNIRLITGTAGCGKTLILLFRARLSASLNTQQKTLVLMHNKPLRADLSNRANELGLSSNIEWRTFYSWIHSMMKLDIIPPKVRSDFIKTSLKQAGLEKRIKATFLLDEFEWISDNGPERITLEWYLKSPRTGRKRPLQEKQRQAIYNLYVSYRKLLNERGQLDWPVAPRQFLKKLQDGEIPHKDYHTIYIDEAQFFAPVWFKCVRAMLHNDYGRLFMAADPTQGFLRSGQSWTQILGGDMRGRSQRLTQPYRNSRAIMSLAKHFYQSRAEHEDDEVNIPSEHVIQNMPDGAEPELVYTQGQPTPTIIVQQLKQLFSNGLNPGHLLIIEASGQREDSLLDLLQKHFPNQIISAAKATNRAKMRVTTINACTGIESPVVVIVGMDRLFEAEDALHLDAIERAELIKQNTKKIFVAITRAAQRLVIIHQHESTQDKLLSTSLQQ